VIASGKVYVTACSGFQQTRLHVLCYEAATGKKLWERQFWATGPTNCNPKTCPAAPTPVADGSHVFALFGSGDLVCLDHSGNLCWLRTLQTDYPAMVNFVGRAASPVLHNGLLIVPLENQGASFLLGLDAATGRNRWRVDRPLENSYTTPLFVRRGNRRHRPGPRALIYSRLAVTDGPEQRARENRWIGITQSRVALYQSVGPRR